MPVSDLPPLRDVIARHGLAARKGLGQHFLLDLNLTQKIVREASLTPETTVVEIGPGPGGLTRALLESPAKKVIVIEKDQRCLPVLEQLQEIYGARLSIHMGDALEVDLVDLAPSPRAVVANLPYNVGTAMLIRWLYRMEAFESLTLMFQAEVVDRILAAPQTKVYGRLSVLAQFCCDARCVMKVPARAFTPPPKVDSAVVRLVPRANRPQDVSLEALAKVTEAAFGQRRKMLRSSLKPLGGETLLNKAKLSPEARAEDLSLESFEALVRCLRP